MSTLRSLKPIVLLLMVLVVSSMVTGVPLIIGQAGGDSSLVVFEFSETVHDGSRELAVAFHSINFIDAEANSLGEIVFGTPEANALQEEGWFANEEWPDVALARALAWTGSFQWAGGPSRRASMRLRIPEETEGLLLNVTSIVDGLWMNVTVDGRLAATLRVDGYWHWGDQYWHSGYVPVGEAVHAPIVTEEPEWTEGDYFPLFPAARDPIYSIWVRHELDSIVGGRVPAGAHADPSWLVNDSYKTMMALTLVGMQGLINRNGPSLFLNYFPSPIWATTGDPWFWNPILREHVEVKRLELDSLSAVNFLMRRYGDRFEGAVIYNPAVPDTINLATMLAGLENRMILAPEQLGLPGIPEFDDVMDLRELAREQGWEATEEGKYLLYCWVYENLWPRLDHRILGIVSPGPPTSADPQTPLEGWSLPLGLASRDYIVALRLSALWVSPSVEPQAGLFARFLEDAPSPIPVMGIYGLDEVGTAVTASRYGDWNLVFSNANTPMSGTSLTVLTGLRPEPESSREELDLDRMFATLGDAPVAMISTSDGDSMQYDLDMGFRNFPWYETQGHRFGFSINPTLVELAPLVWNEYVESRSEASLICGLSGAGLCHPALMSEEQLRDYLEYTAKYLEETGIRVIEVNSRDWYELGEDIARLYYEELSDMGFLGTLGGYGYPWGIGFHYEGVPTPVVFPSYNVQTGENAEGIVENLLYRKPGEVFVDFADPHSWQKEDKTGYPGLSGGQVVDDADAHNGDAVLFSTDEPEYVMNDGPFATMAPGDYRLVLRLKVQDNRDTDTIARVYIAEMLQDITVVDISPSDLAEAGEYQNITIPFTLDDINVGIRFRFDYYGGPNAPPGDWASTDLHLDYMVAEREGGLDLPVFASILLQVTVPGTPEALQLAEEIEEAGGLTMQPDEFIASLNPEYMIEWATPILDQGDPQLETARELLETDDFLGSLLAVREALRNLPERIYLLEIPEEGMLYSVTIRANTWITPIEYHAGNYTIDFRTHGPPEGAITAAISIPNELQEGTIMILLDGQPYEAPYERNVTYTTYHIEVDQGPHGVEIALSLNKPPNASYTYAPFEPTILDSVRFSDNSSDPEGAIARHEWDFGDGSTSAETEPVHTYDEKGEYTVTLTVTDDEGLTHSISRALTIYNVPPTADFSFSPSSPKVGETIEFSDQSADPEGDPLEYHWDFGDGSSSTQSSPRHVYSSPRVMRVSLMVADDEGAEGVALRSVTVEALKPAEFEISDLRVEPGSVFVGEEVIVHVVCTNVGEESGEHSVTLMIDDEEVDKIALSLEPGESESVAFTVLGEDTGIHTVGLDGQSGRFTVKRKGIPGFPVISVILGILAGVIVIGFQRTAMKSWFTTKSE